MNFSKSFTGLLFQLILHLPLFGQNSWTLEKEKNGIKISSRHSDTSPFNDVRVEVDLPGNIDQLAAILLDVANYTKWAYATKTSAIIKQLAPGSLIYYSEIEVPWPATDRYFFAKFELKTDPNKHTAQVLSSSVPDAGPVPVGLVKVPYSKGTWNISTLSKKMIHVDYVLQLNPGGSLPAWILNLFSTKGPMETFENIKQKMIALNPSR